MVLGGTMPKRIPDYIIRTVLVEDLKNFQGQWAAVVEDVQGRRKEMWTDTCVATLCRDGELESVIAPLRRLPLKKSKVDVYTCSHYVCEGLLDDLYVRDKRRLREGNTGRWGELEDIMSVHSVRVHYVTPQDVCEDMEKARQVALCSLPVNLAA